MPPANPCALVTGASSGLGLELARVFANGGFDVGLVVRNAERGEALADELGADLLVCDLASMASVRAAAAAILQSGRAVDILMLNAGVFGAPFQRTAEGFEATFAANYLGHFLLVHLLGEAGAFAPGARIVSTLTSSVGSNLLGKADLPMLTQPDAKRFSSLRASSSSKVLLALMALELSRHPGIGFRMLGVNPGAVRTGNLKQTPALLRPIARSLMKPVELGVEPLVWAATDPQLPQGLAFDAKHRPMKLNRDASDPALARRLWSESERILGLPAWPG